MLCFLESLERYLNEWDNDDSCALMLFILYASSRVSKDASDVMMAVSCLHAVVMLELCYFFQKVTSVRCIDSEATNLESRGGLAVTT